MSDATLTSHWFAARSPALPETQRPAATPEPFTGDPQSQDPSPGVTDPNPPAADPEPFTANPEPFTTNPEPFTTNPEPFTTNPEPFTGDPEQALAEASFPLDPATLRETVPNRDFLRSIRSALTLRVADATDPGTRARLLGLRAVVHRLLGDLGPALQDAQSAVADAESTGQFRRIALSRARLARVHQWRGEYDAADELYAKANSAELPTPLRASLHAHISRSAYEQGRLTEACLHLERALILRRLTFDQELISEIEVTLDAIAQQAAAAGFGPPPRQAEVVEHRIPAGDYADAQPYRDGRAWVRRTEQDQWQAIDESENIVIDACYDDVRPFRYGVAAVRRSGGWGAVDVNGKVVLSCSYDLFCTALADGRYVEGFTEEGLAVVEQDGLKGVVDRTGAVILRPAHRGLVIHPVAYLIFSADRQWGALDRQGVEIIAPVFGSRSEVIEYVESLLSAVRPVL